MNSESVVQQLLEMQECVTTIRGLSSDVSSVLSDLKELYCDSLCKDLQTIFSFVWQLRVVLEPLETSERWEFASKFYFVDSKDSVIYAVEKASSDILSDVTKLSNTIEL